MKKARAASKNKKKWAIVGLIFLTIYTLFIFIPFLSPFAKYPYYFAKCMGMPITSSGFAAGSGYEVPSEGWNVTPVTDKFFCTEAQAQAAGLHKNTRLSHGYSHVKYSEDFVYDNSTQPKGINAVGGNGTLEVRATYGISDDCVSNMKIDSKGVLQRQESNVLRFNVDVTQCDVAGSPTQNHTNIINITGLKPGEYLVKGSLTKRSGPNPEIQDYKLYTVQANVQ